jgi:Tfp pilus assembly protein PilO
MKLQMSSANRTIVAMLVVAALAAAFWILLLSPKREEASELATQIAEVQSSLALHQAEAAEAEEARRQFPADYRRLVVLGKAVPGDDDVASLLVQLNGVAGKAGGTFRDISLSSEGSGGEAAAPAAAGGAPVSATEAAASLLPLGATIGPAGLGVMPYTISFDGSFFEIADFIEGLDSLVETGGEGDEISVKGRLVTVDSFSLSADASGGFPVLQASFSVTTYLTPPGEGIGGGASPASTGLSTATPAATTLGGAP